jgi:hypothetical protein
MRGHLESVPHFIRGGRATALIEGLIVILNLDALRPKFCDVLIKSGPTSDIWNNVVQSSAIVLASAPPRRGNNDWWALAFK